MKSVNPGGANGERGRVGVKVRAELKQKEGEWVEGRSAEGRGGNFQRFETCLQRSGLTSGN